jgi:lipopolysaccharide biosynthesis glycosyltransferase
LFLASGITSFRVIQDPFRAIDGSLFSVQSMRHRISLAVAFGVNQAHIQRAFVTIYSIFRHFRPMNYTVSFRVFVSDLVFWPNISAQLLCIRAMQPSLPVSVVNFKSAIVQDLYIPVDLPMYALDIPYAVLFRLYYPEVLSDDFILSMDTDMYTARHFLGELMEIIARDRGKASIYAVSDYWAKRCYRPRFSLRMRRYVNGGFFVVRNNEEGKWLMRLARSELAKHIHQALFRDQDALNLAIHQRPWKLYMLPGYFNCHYIWCRDDQLLRQAIHHRKDGIHLMELREMYSNTCKVNITK